MPKKSAGTTLLKSKAIRIEIRGGNNETHPGRTLMVSSEITFPSNINFADSDEASVNLKKSNSITRIKKKDINFHARYSAKKKIYKYIILNRKTQSPMYDKRVWLVKNKLNVLQMKKGIKFYLGTHNFTSMRAASCVAKSPIRTITKAQINKKSDKIIITFESKSFLQKQVRSMVGCLKYVGENKWKPEKIKSIIKLKKRELCAPPAPPEGLYLEKVFY